MKSYRIALVALCAAMVSLAAAGNAEETKKERTYKCPLAGKEIKLATAKQVSYKGKTVYVCCGGCKAKVEKDASKFAEKLNKQLVETGQYVQAKCPISGGPMNKTKTVKIGGVEVAFCCPNCQGKASKAKGDEQLKLAFSDKAFAKVFKEV